MGRSGRCTIIIPLAARVVGGVRFKRERNGRCTIWSTARGVQDSNVSRMGGVQFKREGNGKCTIWNMVTGGVRFKCDDKGRCTIWSGSKWEVYDPKC